MEKEMESSEREVSKGKRDRKKFNTLYSTDEGLQKLDYVHICS